MRRRVGRKDKRQRSSRGVQGRAEREGEQGGEKGGGGRKRKKEREKRKRGGEGKRRER